MTPSQFESCLLVCSPVLGTELRTSCILVKHSTTEPHPPAVQLGILSFDNTHHSLKKITKVGLGGVLKTTALSYIPVLNSQNHQKEKSHKYSFPHHQIASNSIYRPSHLWQDYYHVLGLRYTMPTYRNRFMLEIELHWLYRWQLSVIKCQTPLFYKLLR